MKVKETIEIINNAPRCYSLWDAEDILKGCEFTTDEIRAELKRRADY